jgi:hypothetical protein
VHCRQAACPDSAILQYFLSRLTGEVKTGTAPVSVDQVLKSKTLTKDDMVATHGPMGMSKEKQWNVHQELTAISEKYRKQKPWKKLSEEEKDALVKEKIRGSK